MIGAGLLAIAVMGVTEALVRSDTMKKSVKARSTASNAEAILLANLSQKIRSETKASQCFPYASVYRNAPLIANKSTWAGSSGGSRVRFSEDISLKMFASRAARRAAHRCLKSSAGNPSYFCVKLTKDSKAVAESPLGSGYGFAEVSIQYMDFVQNTPVSCGSYVHQPERYGALLFVAIHWPVELPGAETYMSKKYALKVGGQ